MLIEEVRNGYFYSCIASDPPIIEYHKLRYFISEEDLYEYLDIEYRGTDSEEILDLSIKELKRGVSYLQRHRMGDIETTIHIRLFHGDNIWGLFSVLDDAELRDCENERIDLSAFLENATDESDVIDVIEAYNDFWDNYW